MRGREGGRERGREGEKEEVGASLRETGDEKTGSLSYFYSPHEGGEVEVRSYLDPARLVFPHKTLRCFPRRKKISTGSS